MDVIRHQDVGVQRTSVSGARDRQATPEDVEVSWSFEERRTIIAPLNDVLGLARDAEAWKSRHWSAGNAAAVPSAAVTVAAAINGPAYAYVAANAPPFRFWSDRDIPKFNGVRLH